MNDHKNIKTIEVSIYKAWHKLPKRFHARALTGKVYADTDLDVYADSIMHTLRYMRRDGKINYICVNRKESLYEKKP